MNYTFFKILLYIGYLALPFSLLGNSLVILSMGLPILFICGLYGLIFLTRSHSINRESLLLGGVFAVVPIVTSLFAFDLSASLIRSLSGLLGFLIFISFVSLYRQQKFIFADCLYVTTASGVVLSLYYIINFSLQSMQYGFSRVISERTVGGLASLPWGASNTISAVLLFSLITSLYLIGKHKKVNFVHAAFLIILSGICLTLSRTGILLAAILLTFYFFQNNFFRKLPILLLIAIILLGFTYYWSVNDPTSFESIFIDRVDVNGGNGRFDIWVQKVDFFTKNASNPIGYYSSLYVFDGVSAHNFFLTTLIEQSILGLLSLMFLFYPFLRKKAFLGENRLLLFGLLLSLANLFFEDANSNQQYIFTFWLYMTIVYTVMQGNSTQKAKTTTTFRMT